MNNTGITTLNNLLGTPSKDLATSIAEGVRQGTAEPTEVFIALKKFKKMHDLFFDSKANKANKDVKENMEEAILQHKEGSAKTFTVHGAKITEASRGYWDYSNTNDPYYNRLKELEKNLKDLIKIREEYLQNKVKEWEANNNPLSVQQFGLKPFNISWDNMPELHFPEAYGEVTTNPPSKKSTSSLRVSL